MYNSCFRVRTVIGSNTGHSTSMNSLHCLVGFVKFWKRKGKSNLRNPNDFAVGYNSSVSLTTRLA